MSFFSIRPQGPLRHGRRGSPPGIDGTYQERPVVAHPGKGSIEYVIESESFDRRCFPCCGVCHPQLNPPCAVEFECDPFPVMRPDREPDTRIRGELHMHVCTGHQVLHHDPRVLRDSLTTGNLRRNAQTRNPVNRARQDLDGRIREIIDKHHRITGRTDGDKRCRRRVHYLDDIFRREPVRRLRLRERRKENEEECEPDLSHIGPDKVDASKYGRIHQVSTYRVRRLFHQRLFHGCEVEKRPSTN